MVIKQASTATRDAKHQRTQQLCVSITFTLLTCLRYAVLQFEKHFLWVFP